MSQLISDTIIDNSASADGSGAGWGGHRTPFCVTADGTEWTVYSLDNPDPLIPNDQRYLYHKLRVMNRRVGQSTFDEVDILTGSQEAGNIFALGSNSIGMIYWNADPANLLLASPRMCIYNTTTGKLSENPIPGDWQITNWAYATVGISPGGLYLVLAEICVVGTSDVPGLLKWAVYGTLTGIWDAVRNLDLPKRIAYVQVSVGNNDVAFTGTTDLTWAEAGYNDPHNGNNYVWDEIVTAYYPSLTSDVCATLSVKKTHQQTNEWINLIASSVLRIGDTLYILWEFHGPENSYGYSNGLTVVQLGCPPMIVRESLVPTPFAFSSRIVTDGVNLHLFSLNNSLLYHAVSSDNGLTWDSSEVASPIQLDSSYSLTSRHFMGEKRNGSKVSTAFVGGALQGSRWMMYKVETNPTVTPPNDRYDEGYAVGWHAGYDSGLLDAKHTTKMDAQTIVQNALTEIEAI